MLHGGLRLVRVIGAAGGYYSLFHGVAHGFVGDVLIKTPRPIRKIRAANHEYVVCLKCEEVYDPDDDAEDQVEG